MKETATDTSNESPEPRWEDWKKKPWASVAAKKADEMHWSANSALKRETSTPFLSVEESQKKMKEWDEEFHNQMKHGKIVRAVDSSDSEIAALQTTVDKLAADFGMQPPPLLIDLEEPMWYENPNVVKVCEEGIVAKECVYEGYTKCLELFRGTVAHELAHGLNDDLTFDSRVKSIRNISNQKCEILADRMGAIIHGNAREYAAARTRILGVDNGSDTVFNDFKNHHSQLEYLSRNGRARAMHKWADILESAGATVDGQMVLEQDEQGKMRPLKALEVYNRTKDITEQLYAESLKFGITHPQGRG